MDRRKFLQGVMAVLLAPALPKLPEPGMVFIEAKLEHLDPLMAAPLMRMDYNDIYMELVTQFCAMFQIPIHMVLGTNSPDDHFLQASAERIDDMRDFLQESAEKIDMRNYYDWISKKRKESYGQSADVLSLDTSSTRNTSS